MEISKKIARATSTMEADFIGCFEGTKQAVWLKNCVQQVKLADSIERPW